jgi:hypothetical protein
VGEASEHGLICTGRASEGPAELSSGVRRVHNPQRNGTRITEQLSGLYPYKVSFAAMLNSIPLLLSAPHTNDVVSFYYTPNAQIPSERKGRR